MSQMFLYFFKMNVNGAAQIIWSFNNLMIMFEFILKSLNFNCRIYILLNLSSL